MRSHRSMEASLLFYNYCNHLSIYGILGRMKLIVGLNNPGSEYLGTRHNIGEHILRTIIAGNFAGDDACEFQDKPKFKAEICQVQIGDEKVILALPHTFYNLCGESVRVITDFYKIEPKDVLVVHDELALPFGTIRNRVGGSDAGNNGIKSVIQHIGQRFSRIRVGILNEDREKLGDAAFVLSRFSSTEQAQMPDIIKEAKASILSFIQDAEFGATTKRIKR